jgi:exopolyphosphatase / guanosine-5'-triphosphate,3'-diphosphate pyrophosphatase
MIAYRFYNAGILKNKTSYDFKMDDYRAIHDQLIFSTTAERKKMKGLIAMRVDMIVIAAIILTFVLDKLKIKDMRLSTYALKEGALWKILNNQPI